MIYTNTRSSFPDQVVPVAVKNTEEYGLQVARAIEGEWFRNNRSGYSGARYAVNYNRYHNLRLYARGEQSIQKYKDELSINGDLSYLNLDWQPVPVIPKFVDIVVNGMSQRTYDIKAYAQDPVSLKNRTDYGDAITRDFMQKDQIANVKEQLGIDLSSGLSDALDIRTMEDVSTHMQMDYKQSIEVAEEELIRDILDTNRYDLTKRRMNYDLAVLGIGAVKTNFNLSKGVTVEYVDPVSLIYSYTEDPNFQDLYYVGEVKSVSLSDIKMQFPNLTDSELAEIQRYPGNTDYIRNWNGRSDDQTVQVLYFEYKTYMDQVFKIKQTPYGLDKAIIKTDEFDPPVNDNFNRVSRSIEVLYSGAKILGHPLMLKWEMSENMTRPLADVSKVNMNYSICAPRMYKGKIQSLVNKVTGFADMIQLTHLKLQQVLARMVPDGVYLDMDGLAEVDLGNGTNYNPAEALNMYFQTGSIVGRSLTQDGELNHGKVPIQELQSSSGQSKIQSLIATYQYYLQMIRDVTGLNEARDGSSPDKYALVGLQKLAAANSNTATRHILQASLYLTLRMCENITLRVGDALNYPLTRAALERSISKFNVGTLDELTTTTIHNFGIFLELEPDEEEREVLEQNIQIALKTQSIDLEDAIDIRQVKNLKLANEMLKTRRVKKGERDQELQRQNIQAQAQANAEQAERAAMAEVQKQQALAQSTVQIEQSKSQMELQKMLKEAEIKKQIMEIQHAYDMEIERLRVGRAGEKEAEIEERKDKRTRIQATQQSKMIDQRKNNLLPTDFEKEKEGEEGITPETPTNNLQQFAGNPNY